MTHILLVVDTALLRKALAAVLSMVDGFEVIADVDTGGLSAATARCSRADVAVIDLNNGCAAAFGAVRTVVDRAPSCGVLALTGVAAPTALRRALDSRVRGFLSTDAGTTELVAAIRRVAAGERFIDAGVARATLQEHHNPLTPREVDVLRLAANGLSTTEIADELFLTKGTVRNYLSAVLRKVGARSRLHAVRRATEANWL